MRTKEMRETIRTKNELIVNQTRRILLLEDKMTELRKRYFQLKHADVLIHLRTALWKLPNPLINKNNVMKTRNNGMENLLNKSAELPSNQEQGKVVQRYNIALGQIESYFIPSSKLKSYESARFRQDLNAQKKYGTRI